MKRAAALFGGLWLGLCLNVFSQSLSLGVSSGAFFPKDKTYRDIYAVSIPLEFEVRVGVFRHLGLAAGVSSISDSGAAVNVSQGPDRYPVRFRMVSFPLSVYLLFPMRAVTLLGGAGMGLHSYEETWQTVTLSRKGTTSKPFVYAGVEYRVLPRLAARLTLRYENIGAGKNPYLANEINLGGLSLLAGVAVRVF